MKIVDLLKRESVELNGKVTSKPEAIEKMVALMAAGGNLADVEAYKKGVFAREEESTTGIGEGIAIPSPIPVVLSSSLANTPFL